MFISSLVRCQICINTRRRCKPHFHTMISFTLSECSSQLGARSQQIRVGAASHVARWRTMAMRRGRVKFWRNSKWTDQSDQSARSYREGRRSPKESTPSVMNESIHVSTVAVLTAEFDVGENRSCMRWAKYICRWIMALKCVLWQCVEVESSNCSCYKVTVVYIYSSMRTVMSHTHLDNRLFPVDDAATVTMISVFKTWSQQSEWLTQTTQLS